MKKDFQYCYIQKNNGSSESQFVDMLLKFSHMVIECGLNSIGYGFDGDSVYLPLVENFCSKFNKILLNLPLEAQIADPGILLFEDLLYLVKCIRYQFVFKSRICPYPHSIARMSIDDL